MLGSTKLILLSDGAMSDHCFPLSESYQFPRVPVCNRVGPQDEKSSNLHITADLTGSMHKNARGKKFDPKKIRLGCGDLI